MSNDANENDRHREDGHWHAERRDKMAADGLRSLLLLNGGGAVALLAFVQAIWAQPTAQILIPWVLTGMAPLLVGAALGAGIHFVRYETSEVYQAKGRKEGQTMTRLHKRLTTLGFACFVVGMAIIVFGAFQSLPEASHVQGRHNVTIRVVVQVLALAAGVVAAILWWWASTLKPKTVSSLDGIASGDGDLALQYAPDKILVWRVSLQGGLNAWAATCTGIAIILQAVAGIIPNSP